MLELSSIQLDYNDRHSVCLCCKIFSVTIMILIQCVNIASHSAFIFPDVQFYLIARHSECLNCRVFLVSILPDVLLGIHWFFIAKYSVLL